MRDREGDPDSRQSRVGRAPLRVLITTQVFPPEIHPSAVMVHQLSEHLAATGHRVVVACGYPHHPQGRVMDGYSRRPVVRESMGSVAVVRGWHLVSSSPRVWRRALVMASQSAAIGVAAALSGSADVVINYGPPLAGPLLSWSCTRGANRRLVSVVYDIYPDTAIRNGSLRNPLLVRLARIAERATYRVSRRVLVLSEGFRTQLERKGVPSGKIAVVPVWLARDEIRPMAHVNSWRREQGIDDGTQVVLYAGTIGVVSGAEMMADVAASVVNRPKVLFLFVGDGQRRAGLEAAARARGLANVRLLPFQPRERLCEVQAASDVSVVTLSKGNGYSSVPSKVIAYMAAGRPVVASVDGDCDTAETIRAAGCGIVVPPGDSAAMAAAITTLLDRPLERERAGVAARRAFEQEFAAEAVLPRYAELLEAVAREGRR